MSFKVSQVKKAVSVALFSSTLTLSVSSNVFAAGEQVTPFVPGETKVENGDMVSYDNECYIAKNNPGVWETPSASASWFWDEVDCPGTPGEPPAGGDVIPFIPG
ncbi:hypothetical protein [Psychromonas ossibalaenae]|uniref:hypothetical protein n=1 Tax=Psychromonas ossibalaenae TaxID=444922 RepID=UPI00035E5ACC|nr:hypothetical protein [Psychromonas ossibalaenae]